MKLKKNICEDCCKGKRISELDEKVDIQGTEYIPYQEGDDNGKFSLGSLKDYLIKLIEEYLINNGIIREDWVQSEPAYKLLATLPELIADRACKDEFGNNINDTYLTRESVKEYIGSIFEDLFTENPPKILDGYITVDMLSDAVLQLLNSGGCVTNFPDDEDLTVKDGKLKFKDKAYDPNNYSGFGRKYLRKNMVDGVNVLTQEMINSANTRYIIQYDYDLNGQTITIPEGCVLQFEGGSFSNGTVQGSYNCQFLFSSNKCLGLKVLLKDNSVLDGMQSEDNDSISEGVIVISGTNIKVKNVNIIIDSTNNKIDDCSGVHIKDSDNVLVSNCIVSGSRNQSYVTSRYASICAVNSTSVTVENCKVTSSQYEGIFFDTCSYSKIEGCEASNVGYSGIGTMNGQDNIISNNIAHHTGTSCITVNDINCIITGNIVYHNEAVDVTGITLGHSAENTHVEDVICTNNQILGEVYIGIGGTTLKNAIISNNIIKNTKNHGIYFVLDSQVRGNVTISDNKIQQTGYFGIQVISAGENRPTIVVSDNTISNTAQEAMRILTGGVINIRGNVIDSCKKIVVGTNNPSSMSISAILSGNIFTNASETCLEIFGCLGIYLYNNRFHCNHANPCIKLSTSFQDNTYDINNYTLVADSNLIYNYTGAVIDATDYSKEVYNQIQITNNFLYSPIELTDYSDWIKLTNPSILLFYNNSLDGHIWESLQGDTDKMPSWVLTDKRDGNTGLHFYDKIRERYLSYTGVSDNWINEDGTLTTKVEII